MSEVIGKEGGHVLAEAELRAYVMQHRGGEVQMEEYIGDPADNDELRLSLTQTGILTHVVEQVGVYPEDAPRIYGLRVGESVLRQGGRVISQGSSVWQFPNEAEVAEDGPGGRPTVSWQDNTSRHVLTLGEPLR